MSQKTQLKRELMSASKRAGGSHDTRQNREHFIGSFVHTIFLLGFPLRQISQIGVRVITKFVEAQIALGQSKRTVQN